jgi:hypothetical protein
VLVVETTSTPSSPASGRQRVYVNATNHALSMVDSTGRVGTMPFFRGAMVKNSSDLTSVNYTAEPTLTWNSEIYDTDGFHSNSTSDYTKLTVPSGVSRVNVSATARIENVTASVSAALTLLKNGSNTFDGAAGQHVTSSFSTRNLNLAAIGVPVSSGDYFEVALVVVTDTAVDLIANRSHFSIQVAE